MSSQSGTRVLVLGGIRSGKSELAEALVAEAGASVRYVATAVEFDGDAGWSERLAAHRRRRPADWATEEVGADPGRLVTLLAEAKPDEALLVDDLGGWVAAGTGGSAEALAGAVRDCPARRLVIVSPEVGLSVVPATAAGRDFADALGTLNRSVADACDAVVLVVAGQPAWVKGARPPAPGVPVATSTTTTTAAPTATTAAVALAAPPAAAMDSPVSVGMSLPMPDDDAAEAARARLARLDVAGPGLGALVPLVAFAAGTQRVDTPRPWKSVRLLLVHGDHDGGVAAGDPPTESARRIARATAGEGPLALLAGAAGVTVEAVRCGPAAAAIETGDAMSADEVDAALAYGWQLASSAVDAGTDALVLGSCGAGADAAAVAVIATCTHAEVPGLLARVIAAGGRLDDASWMLRCAALRDALHRIRDRSRQPHDLLAALGGTDLAVATGALLGAASRETPVLVDGPVGLAAGLLARDIAWQSRYWLLLPDVGGHPATRHAAEMLGVNPLLELRLGLGEGAAALAALPLLRGALTVASTVPALPVAGASADDTPPASG